MDFKFFLAICVALMLFDDPSLRKCLVQGLIVENFPVLIVGTIDSCSITIPYARWKSIQVL